MAPTPISSSLDLLKKIFENEIGTEEVPRGSNTGPKVREYQDADTLEGTGYSWCSSFVVWCMRKWCKELGVEIPIPATASCDVLLSWAKKNGCLHKSPKAGDIFLVLATPTDAHHTGYVRSVSADGKTFQTVEGNSNSSGSREGYEVASNPRKVSSRFVFVRFVEKMSPLDLTLNKTATVLIGGKPVGDFEILNGDIMFPVRKFIERIALSDKTLKFDADTRSLVYDGRTIPSVVTVKDGESFVPLAKLCRFFGLRQNTIAEGSKYSVTK